MSRRQTGRFTLFLLLALVQWNASAPAQTAKTKNQAAQRKASTRLASVLDPILNDAVETRIIPGAVAIVGHNRRIVYRRAFGQRSLEPRVEGVPEPMTVDTIFDAASLTKPVATTTSIMKLVEQGRVRLNDPVAKYIPEFAANGKDEITVRSLMTHYSGLRPSLPLKDSWTGYETALQLAFAEKPVNPQGAVFVYSDINYIVLGELVRRVSGLPLNEYAAGNVFRPIGMAHTRFLPPDEWRARIAPTEFDETNTMLRGTVHDPTARRMGGVAGHAGMFTTADDLAKFASALLGWTGTFPLSRPSILKMSSPQQPPQVGSLRGLGWDIDSPYASNRGEFLPLGSFGHTGFTGTSLWIDPQTDTFVVLMTNAVHPRVGNSVVSLRSRFATAVAAALSSTLTKQQRRALLTITGYNETTPAWRRVPARNARVQLGIDVLRANNFAELKPNSAQPRAIGLLTNHTGVDSRGQRTIDVLAKAPGLRLAAIFGPEHSITGTQDTANITHSTDAATGIPVYSVYGAKDSDRRPSQDVLKTLDAVVVDIQDVGARFYTYSTTLGYFLEAAAQAGIETVVLDRPNPITGTAVQGPISDPGTQSFVNYHPVPVRHGMTIGELARFFNGERKIGAKLTVVPMQQWLPGDWFDATNVTWIDPSPNMRSLTQATLYTGVCLLESTNVSVGRGTGTPFEVIGAPWISARDLAEYLNRRMISGVRFVPINFTPKESKFANQQVGGVNIVVTDRAMLDAPQLGIELASALRRMYGEQFEIDKMQTLLANRAVLEALKAGQDPRRIADDWRDALAEFETRRAPYLLYR